MTVKKYTSKYRKNKYFQYTEHNYTGTEIYMTTKRKQVKIEAQKIRFKLTQCVLCCSIHVSTITVTN